MKFFYILLFCILNIASSQLTGICKIINSTDSQKNNEHRKQNESVLVFRETIFDHKKKKDEKGDKGSSGPKGEKGEPVNINKTIIYELRKQVELGKSFKFLKVIFIQTIF